MTSPRYVEISKSVRNILRPFSATSIVRECLFDLWTGAAQADPRKRLEATPWLTLLVAKIVLRDKQTNLHSGMICPAAILQRCRQMLWDAAPNKRSSGSSAGPLLMVRSWSYQQLAFQQKMDWTFLRWPALFAELAPGHPSRIHFLSSIGMEPEVFASLAWATYTPSLHGQNVVTYADLEPTRPAFGPAIERFIELVSNDLEGIRSALREQYINGSGMENEQFELPWMHKFPLLRVSHNRFAIWHPLVLARGLESAIHRCLTELGQTYAANFSKVFEAHVLSLIRESGLTVITDRAFKQLGNKSFAAVDAILETQDANVFIEVKMSPFS